ncbi:helix-turn-helix domain-containing protein [Xanthobacter pseudotagetidis]|uniref:helix-turn-helix domain-containing protein n=1 Tax=Xanthobacter pseudotagetidis TaxID=3119911 RepID=UPI00372C5C7C
MLPVQCKMARAALGLGVRDLAQLARVSPDTVARLERGEALRDKTISEIRSALEAGGIRFVADGEIAGGGPGVRIAPGTAS